jgi:hypothetical protein
MWQQIILNGTKSWFRIKIHWYSQQWLFCKVIIIFKCIVNILKLQMCISFYGILHVICHILFGNFNQAHSFLLIFLIFF